MAQTPEAFLKAQLSGVELPEDLAFVQEEEAGQAAEGADEQALAAFLREFEDENELLEDVGLFPPDDGG